MSCQTPIIVALDFPSRDAALALAEQLAQAPAKLLISRQKYAQATLALAGVA